MSDIQERIKAAIKVVCNRETGPLLSIPPRDTDVDMVLVDCDKEIATLTAKLADAEREIAERVAVMGAALVSIRYHAVMGHQDRPAHERLRLIAEEIDEALSTKPAEQEGKP